MRTFTVILKVSEEILAGQEVADTAVLLESTEKVTITEFIGNAPFSPNSVVEAVWDYGGVNEEIIWSTKGSQTVILNEEIKNRDGIKKLAIVCSNGESGPVIMSGRLKYEMVN